MLNYDNIIPIIKDLGFVEQQQIFPKIWTKSYEHTDATLAVDFTNNRFVYPSGIQKYRETTVNFFQPENIVVFECVDALLTKGYKPEQIILEQPMPGGHGDTGGFCDIAVQDNNGSKYLLIECKKAADGTNNEFEKAWKDMLHDGGQLFNYYNSFRQAQYVCLYTANWEDNHVTRHYYLVPMRDNMEYLRSNPKLKGFEQVKAEGGTRDDFFRVWKNTYGQDYSTNGVFEPEIQTFHVGEKKLTINDLTEAKSLEYTKGKYNEFASILRQYNVASHENAFDKLVNLFLVKIVDEVRNSNDLQFLWKGAAYDDFFSFQDRLQRLYQIGMKDYLAEEVTYIEDKEVENAFRMQKNDPDAIKSTILEYFRKLKFYSNSDFGFLDVHNEQLFFQNAVILRDMVRMLQDIRLHTDEQNQFLGDLFEGFLDQGVKQNQGQFFTPTPITRFIVSALPLENLVQDNTEIPKAIDYACGAGHFLNEYAAQIKPFVIKYKGAEALFDYYRQIYGIEKEYRLSKVSKVSSFMYGQDGIQIIYGDALVDHADKGVHNGEFKVLVANPPYSVTGFLQTLSKEEREAFTLSKFVDGKAITTNNSIETFFVERAKQLLAPNAIAAIVLPQSILTNPNLHTHAREILLSYFDIIALSEFGTGTFGKAGVNTVVLFLRRKVTNPELCEHYRIRINAWFNQDHSQDNRYQDTQLLQRYCNHIGINYDDYITLLTRQPNEELLNNDIFKAYYRTFNSDAEARKIQRKRITTAYTVELQQQEINQHILKSVIEAEKEKLLYFLLANANPQPVIITKMPEKKEGKLFLGYEWTTRRGNEGLHCLGTVANEDEDDITANQGLLHIKTPLYDPQNLIDDEHLNALIRSNYLGNPINIPEHLKQYVTIANLTDLIDFKKIKFDKAIKTTLEYKTPVVSKYSLQKLEDLFVPIVGDATKISQNEILDEGTYPVITQEVDKIISGYTNNNHPITDLPIIVFGDHSCSFKYVDFPFVRGADGTQLIKTNDSILLKYLYNYLLTAKIEKQGKYERHFKYLKETLIPLPPITIQQSIIDECSKIDNEYNTSRMSIEDHRSKIAQVFENLQVAGISKPLILSQLCYYSTERTSTIEAATYITTDNMLQNCEGITDYTGTTDIPSAIAYKKGDILVSNIRPYLQKIWYADRDGACSPDVLVFRVNNDEILSRFLYLSMKRKTFFDYIMNQAGVKGMKMPRGNKEATMYFKVAVPSITDQQQIITQVEQYEAEIRKAQTVMDGCGARKKAILDKYLN